MAKKPSIISKRMEMKKLKNNLLASFSKRRSGLFKKASELCTLCGVEIAIIVFSPARKVYSFGHPNVESIIDKFFTRNVLPNSSSLLFVEARPGSSTIQELNLQLTQVLKQLEAEQKRGELLDQMRKDSQTHWWEAPIEDLGVDELEELRMAIEVLMQKVLIQADAFNFILQATNTSNIFTVDTPPCQMLDCSPIFMSPSPSRSTSSGGNVDHYFQENPAHEITSVMDMGFFPNNFPSMF